MFPTPTPDTNAIRYRVFFRRPGMHLRGSNAHEPCPVNGDADRVFAESRRAAYAEFVERKVGDFIWHKHAMHFSIMEASADTSSPLLRAFFLEGVTAVGDAIDDEWVVTWLLFLLTTEFPDDEAIVQVNDTDGEFLLIECADALPEWVSPENSANRVFVRRGEVHLVSVDIVPEFESIADQHLQAAIQHKPVTSKKKRRNAHELLVFKEAVNAVFDDRIATLASTAMQRMFQQKIREAPQYMRANRHRVRCLLPEKAAWLIQKQPKMVGAAVEAFYYREPRQATTLCNQMRVFPPRLSVSHLVTMSRCQYAQLKQQHFYPPKPFLHFPGADLMAAGDSSDSETRATEIGVKLVCGLELLYVAGDCDQFGSAWKDIIDEAFQGYREGAVVDALTELEDDDSWLYVHPDSLEDKLHSVATRTAMPESVDSSQQDIIGGAEELQNIATMFNNFMGGISGLEGVESSEPVQLDMGSFLKLLQSGEPIGANTTTAHALDLSDEDWDDLDEDAISEGSSVDSDDELEQESEEDEDRILREAMDEMDAELQNSTLVKTLTRVAGSSVGDNEPAASDDTDQHDKPLDLDFHLLSNLLESMASQEGLAGPVSNILSELTTSR